jgi:GxxExxY protein
MCTDGIRKTAIRILKMVTNESRINQITEKIIGAAYVVANGLGHGFMEKCYENALAHELRKLGMKVVTQMHLDVRYDGIVVGEYIADLIVEDSVIVEVKAIDSLAAIHSAQCINYLSATGLAVCLLINFGKRVDVKRFAGPSMIASV